MSDLRVLIVDDEQAIVRLCERIMQRAEYQVTPCTSPVEALNILRREPIDLLLTDIRMPDMDGFELIEQAKGIQPEMAVLVMTGFGTIETAIQALRRGVDGLLLKPFEKSSELIEAANQVLVEHRAKRDAQRLQVLRPLFDVSEQLIKITDPTTLIEMACQMILELMQAERAGVFYSLEEGSSFRMVFSAGKPFADDYDPSFSEHPLNLLLSHSVPMLSNPEGPGEIEIRELITRLGYGPTMLVPTKRGEKSLVFLITRPKGNSFSESDLELFTIYTRQVAVALENAYLYEDLRGYVHRVEESQRALVQAEKMAAVGRLLASVSHEINNPLQSVRNCVHLSMHKNIGAEQQAKYLDMAKTELDRLSVTIRRMLDFYRPGVDKSLVNSSDMVEWVISLLQPQLNEKHVEIVNNIAQPPPVFLAVPDQIQQVLFNLFLNAIDAVDAVEDLSAQRLIWVDVFSENKTVKIRVEDSGVGVPEETRNQLFEPFFSTKKNGTGLGLAVSFGIIQNHGGNLQIIAPSHGDGACFEISLPDRSSGNATD